MQPFKERMSMGQLLSDRQNPLNPGENFSVLHTHCLPTSAVPQIRTFIVDRLEESPSRAEQAFATRNTVALDEHVLGSQNGNGFNF